MMMKRLIPGALGFVLLAGSMVFQLKAFAASDGGGGPVPTNGDCIGSACLNSSTCHSYTGKSSCSCQGVTNPVGNGSNPGGLGTCQ